MEGPEYLHRARAFSEYGSRTGQDVNNLYTASHSNMSHYPATASLNYYNSNGHVTYSPTTASYSAYTSPYFYNATHSHNHMYIPPTPQNSMSYHVQPPPRNATLPSQSRMLPTGGYHSPHPAARQAMAVEYAMIETEEQESVNEETHKSEPMDPPLQGYPNVHEFDDLMDEYVKELSPKKQDKALIHAARAKNIKTVLVNKKTTTIESAQFRFWVKKMFTLQPNDPTVPAEKKKICHEGKPVAIREKLFKILIKAHQKCQHGGRDKTSAQVRRVYSWVPKELISRFVKACPTCKLRRGVHRNSLNDNDVSPTNFNDPPSPDDDESTAHSRRDSTAASQSSQMYSPPQLAGGSTTFQNQNRWISFDESGDLPCSASSLEPYHNLGSYGTNDYPAHLIRSSGTSRRMSSARTRYKRE